MDNRMPNAKRAPSPDRSAAAGTLAQKSGFYLMSAVVLLVLGATLAATTRVDAAGWFGGDDAATRRERIETRAEFAVDWLLHRIDASEDQRVAIQDVVSDTIADLDALHATGRASHERLAALWTAETVDPAALEEFRSEQMARFEIASRRLTESLTAIASELDAEQRAELVEFAHEHRGRHGRHGHSH